MAFRNIIIQNPAHISAKNSQLIIRTEGEHSLPLEDISALLIESRQSTITTAALSLLGQCGCAVFVCDEKHMPCAVMSPFDYTIPRTDRELQHNLDIDNHSINYTIPRTDRELQPVC